MSYHEYLKDGSVHHPVSVSVVLLSNANTADESVWCASDLRLANPNDVRHSLRPCCAYSAAGH